MVRAKVFVLENGVDPSQSSATLWYAPSPRALTVYPSGGPRSGGSLVRLTTDWNETEWSAAQAAGALDDAVCDFGDAGVVPASVCVAGHPRVRGAFIRTEARAAHRRGVFGRHYFQYTRS